MSKLIRKFLTKIYSNGSHNKLRIWALKRAGNKVGSQVYLGPSFLLISDSSSPHVSLNVGERVSIAPRVTVILVSGANNSKISQVLSWRAGSVSIKDDAWIGTGSVIYPGVTIGKCAIVNAGAIVTKDVPDYAVVGGVPAKVIKSIDSLFINK